MQLMCTAIVSLAGSALPRSSHQRTASPDELVKEIKKLNKIFCTLKKAANE
jgi:hypothetical protein